MTLPVGEPLPLCATVSDALGDPVTDAVAEFVPVAQALLLEQLLASAELEGTPVADGVALGVAAPDALAAADSDAGTEALAPIEPDAALEVLGWTLADGEPESVTLGVAVVDAVLVRVVVADAHGAADGVLALCDAVLDTVPTSGDADCAALPVDCADAVALEADVKSVEREARGLGDAAPDGVPPRPTACVAVAAGLKDPVALCDTVAYTLSERPVVAEDDGHPEALPLTVSVALAVGVSVPDTESDTLAAAEPDAWEEPDARVDAVPVTDALLRVDSVVHGDGVLERVPKPPLAEGEPEGEAEPEAVAPLDADAHTDAVALPVMHAVAEPGVARAVSELLRVAVPDADAEAQFVLMTVREAVAITLGEALSDATDEVVADESTVALGDEPADSVAVTVTVAEADVSSEELMDVVALPVAAPVALPELAADADARGEGEGEADPDCDTVAQPDGVADAEALDVPELLDNKLPDAAPLALAEPEEVAAGDSVAELEGDGVVDTVGENVADTVDDTEPETLSACTKLTAALELPLPD